MKNAVEKEMCKLRSDVGIILEKARNKGREGGGYGRILLQKKRQVIEGLRRINSSIVYFTMTGHLEERGLGRA